jgi:hypothetical protein
VLYEKLETGLEKEIDSMQVKFLGIISYMKKKVTKSDTVMAFVEIEDLYGSVDTLNGTYTNETAKGEVLVLTNVKRINPRVKITDIECYDYSKIDIVTQGKNMLKNDAITETIEGVTFTRFINGAIKISGTSTADIEYNLSGSSDNTTSLFALKKNKDYYLNIGGLDCEFRYYDGTTSQVYIGASGVINLTESKEVTQVLIKIPSETTLEQTIYPMLEYGTSKSEYEEYKHRILAIDFSEYIDKDPLYPSELNIKHSALKTGTTKSGVSKALNEVVETTESLYPSDDLFPKGSAIDYIYIENGSVYISVNGVQKYLMKANVNLFDGFNTIYTMQDTNIEMTYCINNLKLEGTVTKNNNFKVLEDGSIEAHNGYFSGTITAKSGEIAGLTINNDGLTAKSSLYKGYTNADVQRIKEIVMDDITPTLSDYDRLDVNGDGDLSAVDYVIIKKMVEGTYSQTIKATLYINSKDPSRCFRIIDDESGLVAISLGYRGGYIRSLQTESIDVESGDGSSNISADTISVTNFSNDSSADGSYMTADSITTPTVIQTSLEESKKNFEKYSGALEEIKKTDIYKYNLKGENDNRKKHLGFVIGDNYNYSSEITAIDKDGKEIGVDNYSMTSLCLQAIKELSSKVEVLENKIKEMEEK